MKPMTERHLDILRRHMVEVIEVHYDLAGDEIGRNCVEASLRDALLKIPRHFFVPAQFAALAYQDTPLPLGFDKTVSQPFVGALMIDLLEVRPGQQILEVGTGLGYQSAIMAELGADVQSVEIVEEFAAEAAIRLSAVGYDAVRIKTGDGSRGWSEHAPFDRILVTAAAKQCPAALIGQLKPGGRLILPLGGRDEVQHLTVLEKLDEGDILSRAIMPVRFTELETIA